MAYADYEGEIYEVKNLPKEAVENEGNLYCCGIVEWKKKKKKIYGIYFVYLNFYVSEIW